jgi:hypothetical protein
VVLQPQKTAPTRFTTTIIGGKEYTVAAVSNVVNAKMINTAVQRKDARSAWWGPVFSKCLESVQPHFQAGVPLQAVQSPAQAFWSGGGASPFQSPAKLLWPGGGGGAAAFQNPAQAFWPGGGAAAFQSPAPYAAYSSGRSSAPLPQLPPFFATAPAAAAPPSFDLGCHLRDLKSYFYEGLKTRARRLASRKSQCCHKC